MEGPYVVCAAFCERTLQERDDVLTLIRLIDRINMVKHAEGEKEGQGVTFLPRFVVVLRSGAYRGPGKVKIIATTPLGNSFASSEVQVEFREEDQGANVILEGFPPIIESGVYWYGVYLDDRLLTRTPLRLTLEGFDQTTTTSLDESKSAAAKG